MKIIHEWFYRNSYRHVIIINVLSVFVHFGDMLHSKFLCCLFNDHLLCLGNLAFHTYDDYLIYLALTVSLSILSNRFDFVASGLNIVVLTMYTRFCNYLIYLLLRLYMLIFAFRVVSFLVRWLLRLRCAFEPCLWLNTDNGQNSHQ